MVSEQLSIAVPAVCDSSSILLDMPWSLSRHPLGAFHPLLRWNFNTRFSESILIWGTCRGYHEISFCAPPSSTALPYKSQKPTWSGLHKHLTFYVTPRRTTSALPNKLLHQKVHHCTVYVECGSVRPLVCVVWASAKMVEWTWILQNLAALSRNGHRLNECISFIRFLFPLGLLILASNRRPVSSRCPSHIHHTR